MSATPDIQPPQPQQPPLPPEGSLASILSNKQYKGVLALVIAALLGTPISIFATKDDVKVLANKVDVDALQEKVDSLTIKVENMEKNLHKAVQTGDKLADLIDNEVVPEMQRLVTMEEIRKALQLEREKRGRRGIMAAP